MFSLSVLIPTYFYLFVLIYTGPHLVVLVPAHGVLIPICPYSLVHIGLHHLIMLISAGPCYLVSFVLIYALSDTWFVCPHLVRTLSLCSYNIISIKIIVDCAHLNIVNN